MAASRVDQRAGACTTVKMKCEHARMLAVLWLANHKAASTHIKPYKPIVKSEQINTSFAGCSGAARQNGDLEIGRE